ncbi:fatty acid--CoA ligase [Streptomyces sp. AcH 505]|uniref:long-chain-fatty-acid--CoA ligase n=1 Tax=Streptomyces sp. AcH 505 TaxID=352211 RepID=UPI0005A9BE42
MSETRGGTSTAPPIKLLADISRYHADLAPDAVALSFDGRETTYAGLDLASNQVANGLIAAGVGPSARVAILDRNSDRFFEIWFGAAKANAVLVPVNARLAAPEIAFVLQDALVEVLFIGASFLETLGKIRNQLTSVRDVIVINDSYAAWRDAQAGRDPRLAARGDDVCVQLYTSGTTGHPKGVELTNDNFMIGMPNTLDVWGAWAASDVLLLAMPLFHIAGCGVGMLGLLVGLKTIVAREFVPAHVIETIQRERTTVAFLVPAMISALLADEQIERADLSSLRRIVYGASPIPLELLRSAVRVFRHTGFVQIYGLTETTGMISALSPEDHLNLSSNVMTSCGRSVAGVELRIVGADGSPLPPRRVGEITCRTIKNMKGYWKRAKDTARTIKAGWLHTGDAGYLDESGYLYIHDRVKDMIVSGGENIYPAEIENALYGHPDIADIAVIGVPDERWGEAVKALVVLKQGCLANVADILGYARERLAGYKIPKSVEFIDTLPRNPSGKILKRELRERYWRGHERRVN